MGDVLVGAVDAPAPVEAPAAKVNPVVAARAAKLEKMAKVTAGLAKLPSEGGAPAKAEPAVEAKIEKATELAKESDAAEAKADEPKVEAKPVDEKFDDKPVEHDDKTKKALEAIDKQAKKFREEQAAAKRTFESEMAQARADFARERAEWQTQLDEYKQAAAQAKRDPISYLRKLGIESEDEWEAVGRGAFPFTKAGKADPRSQQVVAQTQKERELLERLEAAEKRSQEAIERLELTAKQQEAVKVIESWKAEAVKAIQPNTLVARLHAKSPQKAAEKLLHIAADLERANDGETPSHADVIAELEKRERADLEERGVDVDALLRPATGQQPPQRSKTLDLEAPKGGTRPINSNASRAEKLSAVSQGLRKLEAP